MEQKLDRRILKNYHIACLVVGDRCLKLLGECEHPLRNYLGISFVKTTVMSQLMELIIKIIY